MLGSASPNVNGNEVGDLKDDPSDLITSISVGQRHVCAIVEVSIKCWGEEVYGELGDGAIGISSSNQSIVLGYHSCALFNSDTVSSDYRIMCWGDDEWGQPGLGWVNLGGLTEPTDWVQDGNSGSGDDLITSFKTPDISKTFYRVEEIAAGTDFYCARSIQGLVKCWGRNHEGQLGIGNTTQYGDNVNETGKFLAIRKFRN